MASETAKYSTYLHGLQVDVGDFKRETDEMGRYLHRAGEQASRLSPRRRRPAARGGGARARLVAPPCPDRPFRPWTWTRQ